MPERLHPGVYVEEVKPAVLAIEGASTSTAAFIGVAERGPVGRATLVTGFAQYLRLFGDYRPDSFLTYSVQNFFNNGGKKCYIVRVVGVNAATAAVTLLDRERAALGSGAAEDILADIFSAALAEPVVKIMANSPGQWGNLVDIEIQDATRDPVNEVKLVVKLRDEVVETWDNLSLALDDENYIENLLGADQSQYIQVVRLAQATTDTPAVLISGGSPLTDLTALVDAPFLSLMLNGVTASKIPLAKTGKNTGPKVAAEIQAKVRAFPLPGGSPAEQVRAFADFTCTFVPGAVSRYVLVSGSDASTSVVAVPATAVGAGEVDARAALKLDVAAAGLDKAYALAAKPLQRGASVSGNEPATSTAGNRNLSFSLNGDGFQTAQLDSGLSGGDAVAANIQSKIQALNTQRKNPLNQNAYLNFAAAYTARYELTFGDVAGDAGTFAFVAAASAAKDWSTDARLRLRATTSGSETLYGGNVTGPLAVTPGLFSHQRTLTSGTAAGTRPLADLSGISDGQLRLHVTPPASAAIDLDLTFSGAGPATGETLAAALQAAVRAKASDPALTAFPDTQAALTGFTVQYVAYYTLTSGDVRTVDEAGNPAGPISAVEILPAPNGDIAPALKLGVVNGGIEQRGAARLRPANGEYHLGDNPVGGAVVSVTAGADGDKPQDKDYIGDGVSTGLNALDKLADVNLIAIPGIGSKTVVAAGFGYCVNRPLQDCFFIADLGGAPSTDLNMFRADVPFVTSVSAARDYVRSLPTKNDYGALYFPWVEAPDPIGKGKNPRRLLPPSGYLTGLYARTDGQRGVFKAPAGTEANLNNALDLPTKLGDVEQDFLNPIGVNLIRAFPATGIVAWGARTLGSDSAWRYISVRRMAIFLRVSIYNGIQWAVFEPNDDDLWSSLRLTIGAFMLTQFRAGAFQGTAPDKAYFVKCDASTTTQADIDNGVVNILVGFAPLKPAEFVVVKLSQKAGQSPA